MIEDKDAFEFISSLFESHEFSFLKLESWIRVNVKTKNKNTSEQSENDFGMTEATDAMEAFSSALDEMNFLLEKRADEFNPKDIGAQQTDLLGFVSNLIKWVNLLSADMNRFSERLSSSGERYLQTWTTVSQNIEPLIFQINDRERLLKFAEMLSAYRQVTSQFRKSMSQIFETIYSISESINSLKSLYSQPPSDHKIFSDILKMVSNFESALQNYKQCNDQLNEQLSIILYGVESLAGRAEERLSKLSKDGE